MEEKPDWSWREKGKCWGAHRTGDSDPWFPAEVPNREPTELILQREVAAAELCAGCPVIEQCFEYAVERPAVVGVWGGTLTRQRTAERRKRQKRLRRERHEPAQDEAA